MLAKQHSPDLPFSMQTNTHTYIYIHTYTNIITCKRRHMYSICSRPSIPSSSSTKSCGHCYNVVPPSYRCLQTPLTILISIIDHSYGSQKPTQLSWGPHIARTSMLAKIMPGSKSKNISDKVSFQINHINELLSSLQGFQDHRNI